MNMSMSFQLYYDRRGNHDVPTDIVINPKINLKTTIKPLQIMERILHSVPYLSLTFG